MRSDRLRLQDIIEAIEEVMRYLPPDRAAFDANPPVQSHIYRNLNDCRRGRLAAVSTHQGTVCAGSLEAD